MDVQKAERIAKINEEKVAAEEAMRAQHAAALAEFERKQNEELGEAEARRERSAHMRDGYTRVGKTPTSYAPCHLSRQAQLKQRSLCARTSDGCFVPSREDAHS